MSQYNTTSLFTSAAGSIEPVGAALHEIATTAQIAKNFQSTSAIKGGNPVVGELIFDKFNHEELSSGIVKAEPELQLNLELGSLHSAHSIDELDSAVVDAFFSSSTDSTPMFEFDTIETTTSEPKEWTSLFDNDIPVITEEDVMLNDRAIESTEDLVSDLNTFEMASMTSFLPTPVIEDAELYSKKNMMKPSAGRVTKKRFTPEEAESPEKIDHLGVVTYNRKNRIAPLTPVIAESDDPACQKRARNTEAARRSRARKLQRMNQLEDKVEALLSRNSELENEVNRLRGLLGNGN